MFQKTNSTTPVQYTKIRTFVLSFCRAALSIEAPPDVTGLPNKPEEDGESGGLGGFIGVIANKEEKTKLKYPL